MIDLKLRREKKKKKKGAYAFQAYYYLANQHSLLSLFPLFLALPFAMGKIMCHRTKTAS